jgi:hypothetical protein
MKIYIIKRPKSVTRYIQKAGQGRKRPLKWRYGVAIRLPRNKLLMIVT